MSKSENKSESAPVSVTSEKIDSFGYLKRIWESLKPRDLKDFPAYGKNGPPPPSHWNTLEHHYRFGDTNKSADLVLSEVKDAKRIILYSLGWKSTPAEKQKVIDSFNEMGATVIVLPLTKSDDKVGTMEENIERIGSLAFDSNSILHRYNSKNLPIHIVTHSTGGNAYMHAVHRKSNQIKSVNNIMGAYHTAPFVDAANASAVHQPVKSLIYHLHASARKDQYVGTTLVDRFYYLVNGLADRILTEDPTTRPTHGQNLELIEYGHKLDGVTEEMIDADTLHDIPRETFFYSPDDDFAEEGDIVDLAHHRQVPHDRIISVNGGHSILEVRENRDILNQTMKTNETEHYAYINRPIPIATQENIDFFEQIQDFLDIPEIPSLVRAQSENTSAHAPTNG